MERLIRHRKKILLLIVLLTVVFVGFLTQLRFSFSFEGFFPKEDAEYQYYEAYRERFFEDQNYMIPSPWKHQERTFLTENSWPMQIAFLPKSPPFLVSTP